MILWAISGSGATDDESRHLLKDMCLEQSPFQKWVIINDSSYNQVSHNEPSIKKLNYLLCSFQWMWINYHTERLKK